MSERPNEIEIVEGDLVQWVGNDGGLKTGRRLFTVHGGGRVVLSESLAGAYYTQCRYSQGEKPVLVRSSLLRTYPSSPIPEPTK